MQFDFQRGMDVLAISVPVFALMGLGQFLERRGRLGAERRSFINWLVYYFSLPALIFAEVARQPFESFLNPSLVLLPMAVFVLVGLLMMALARLLGYRRGFAAAFVYGCFWANVTYMGFPLCLNAFGRPGLAAAAVYNALAMPAFLVMAFLLINLYKDRSLSLRDRIGQIVFNPVVAAAWLGFLTATAAEPLRTDNGTLDLAGPWAPLLRLAGTFLDLVGKMGLPLALLAVGGALRLSSVRSYGKAIAMTATAKLILIPLLTFTAIRLLSPGTDAHITGVAVVLGATPNAVASYVVSSQLDVEPDFVASMLVVSTLAAVVTLPVWLYLVV